MSSKTYGHFDDANRSYVITDPSTPRPWTNYLGTHGLQGFISQNAGGMIWYLEPNCRRLTRYHYVASPNDRPGFYLYVKDKKTGTLWNPHFAPTCTRLDRFECRHRPGITSFTSLKDGVQVQVDYTIPVEDTVLLWNITVTNTGKSPAELQLANYVEFSILEVARELWWAYLQMQFHLDFDRENECVRYHYHVYEATYTPRIVVGCTEKASGFECSRDAFLGRTGSLEHPESFASGFTDSELPIGGQACGVVATDMTLAPGESKRLAYCFAMADEWDQAYALLKKYRDLKNVDQAFADVRNWWEDKLNVLQASTGDERVDRFINTWNPYQSMTILNLPSRVSAEYPSIDGIRYRDHTQFAITPANLEPSFAMYRMSQILSSQHNDGMGCDMFFPHTKTPRHDPRQCDNTVWPIYPVMNYLNETGDFDFVKKVLPFCDGGQASVYEHILLGLKYLYDRRGPQGLPLMGECDWNDCMVHWASPTTQTVMLGMQLSYSLQLLAQVADRIELPADAAWCRKAAGELNAVMNSPAVWDGQWYRRLVMGEKKYMGGQTNHEGKLWINTQTWAVICRAGETAGHGTTAMDSVRKHLNSEMGLIKQWPVIGTVPDANGKVTQTGAPPGLFEYGGIYNHTQTWAIMAECMLGRGEYAFEYYRRVIPTSVIERFGSDHYSREPYVYVSSLVGPANKLYGRGGITWITGSVPWMYHAATQYILGIKPTFDGLRVAPCLPAAMKHVKVVRRYRGCQYEIEIDNASRGSVNLIVNGKPIAGDVVPVQTAGKCKVRCEC